MPRARRIVVPSTPLHIVQRGNNRTTMFHSTQERGYYRMAVLEASRRYGCAIHAYVLMSNHVHLLVTPADEGGPAAMMQFLGKRYVPWFNRRHGRTGTLFEGRFRSSLVDSARYLFACSRYIELNPVRAGMVARPADYWWSSHRHNALGIADPIVTPHALYDVLAPTPSERAATYRKLFRVRVEVEELMTYAAVRLAIRRGVPVGGAARGQGCSGSES
jgi:putative transposase